VFFKNKSSFSPFGPLVVNDLPSGHTRTNIGSSGSGAGPANSSGGVCYSGSDDAGEEITGAREDITGVHRRS
jgi:hypothetical protein